jgi:hypothetical protein
MPSLYTPAAVNIDVRTLVAGATPSTPAIVRSGLAFAPSVAGLPSSPPSLPLRNFIAADNNLERLTLKVNEAVTALEGILQSCEESDKAAGARPQLVELRDRPDIIQYGLNLLDEALKEKWALEERLNGASKMPSDNVRNFPLKQRANKLQAAAKITLLEADRTSARTALDATVLEAKEASSKPVAEQRRVAAQCRSQASAFETAFKVLASLSGAIILPVLFLSI